MTPATPRLPRDLLVLLAVLLIAEALLVWELLQ